MEFGKPEKYGGKGLENELLKQNQELDLENGLLEWEIEEHGDDPLTGARTRNVFMRELEKALVAIRTKDQKQPRSGVEPLSELSVVFIDLDNFKQVNDMFDHAMGDEVLKHTVHALKSSVREADVVGRYGGDEFFVLLPRASKEAAATIANKMLATMKSDTILAKFNVSGSIGVCSSAESTDAEHLVKLADNAAKKAKQLGKSQVHVYEQGDEL